MLENSQPLDIEALMEEDPETACHIIEALTRDEDTPPHTLQ